MAWLRPYRVSLVLSAVLILLASFVSVVMEIVISLVLVDYIIRGEGSSVMPDLGMVDLTQWVEGQLHIEPIFAAGLIFFLLLTIYAIAGHAHRMTLISSIVKSLRDLRHDLFAHIETRPSSFFDRVPIGRIMTRVTNDVALQKSSKSAGMPMPGWPSNMGNPANLN